MESLAGASVALVCMSILMFVISLMMDQQIDAGNIPIAKTMSMRLLDVRNAIIIFLVYAAIAFSQDLALEWLAVIALIVCSGASLLRRGIAFLMTKASLNRELPEEMESSTEELPPLLVAGHMAEMMTDILIYVSALDLIILFVMALCEKVIPYYIGLMMG